MVKPNMIVSISSPIFCFQFQKILFIYLFIWRQQFQFKEKSEKNKLIR